MSDWSYSKGEWTPIDDGELWGCKDALVENVFPKYGYIETTRVGVEYSPFSFVTYRTSREPWQGYEFILFVEVDHDIFDLVYIKDVPNYLRFMREHAQLIANGIEQVKYEEVQEGK